MTNTNAEWGILAEIYWKVRPSFDKPLTFFMNVITFVGNMLECVLWTVRLSLVFKVQLITHTPCCATASSGFMSMRLLFLLLFKYVYFCTSRFFYLFVTFVFVFVFDFFTLLLSRFKSFPCALLLCCFHCCFLCWCCAFSILCAFASIWLKTNGHFSKAV